HTHRRVSITPNGNRRNSMKFNESRASILLCAAVTLLAVTMGTLQLSTWLESISFVTGALCVWLTVKQNIWNFPLGLVNVTTYCVVFYRSRLFADAGLQVVYFLLGVIGWYLWLHGGANRTRLHITRISWQELAALLFFVTGCTLGLWQLLHKVGGSASFWDALTTSLSLASQWLLNRKRLESWLGWIIVDLIYVPLYIYKELYLTAVLYGIFLIMAVMGWKAWHASWRQKSSHEVEPTVAGANV
ncbi:MAG: nicotinamide mononucleotide transporter, partial [Planctomycetales bacterium]|nr:nicotinamide mononucleotide transporter [Planctomycetales bacterium]